MTKPLEALRTGDGRELPPLLKAEIRRELDRLALATTQLAAVERARDALIRTQAEERNNPAAQLLKLKGLGPEFASLLWLELLFRSFANRRQVAAYGGLAPSPWQSGGVERDQGISKSGNRRLRKTMIELASARRFDTWLVLSGALAAALAPISGPFVATELFWSRLPAAVRPCGSASCCLISADGPRSLRSLLIKV